jgi:recombination protein RecT
MANDLQTTNNNGVAKKATPQGFIKDLNVQKMITERLGKRAGQFTTSLLSLVNANAKIAECTPITIVQAALTAASMDLPINQNLGFAYIVPYKSNKKVFNANTGRDDWVSTMEAQFQMGWKGFVQLAQRSGKFELINTTEVREGELVGRDRMTGELKFVWSDADDRDDMPVIGYLAYFKLLNGISKSLYMTKAEVEKHAGRYSQAFKGSSKAKAEGRKSFDTPWESDFDLMAQKTALKLLLSKYAPLSTEMQEAVTADQSVDDGTGRQYLDNPTSANDDMANVGADESKQNDIVNQHARPANVDENGEVHDDAVEGEVVAPPADTPAAKAAPKKSVKDMAAERGWTGGKGKDKDAEPAAA